VLRYAPENRSGPRVVTGKELQKKQIKSRSSERKRATENRSSPRVVTGKELQKKDQVHE